MVKDILERTGLEVKRHGTTPDEVTLSISQNVKSNKGETNLAKSIEETDKGIMNLINSMKSVDDIMKYLYLMTLIVEKDNNIKKLIEETNEEIAKALNLIKSLEETSKVINNKSKSVW